MPKVKQKDQDLSQYDGYRVRGRYLKWYIYLFKGDVDTKKEIGPFDFKELECYLEEHCQHMRDIDKG